tara:strand:+ start:3216 stop:3677 length:462 start_codon:yes stop_codon:yes gene_type:complete
MSTKIRAKNPSNILQTLTCDNSGHLNIAFDGLDLTTTNGKLDAILSYTYDRTKLQLKEENVSIGQNQFSSTFDLSNKITTKCRLWGNGTIHRDAILQFSDDNTNWKNSEIIHILDINGEYSFNLIIECPPKYMRIFNPYLTNTTLNIYLEQTF